MPSGSGTGGVQRGGGVLGVLPTPELAANGVIPDAKQMTYEQLPSKSLINTHNSLRGGGVVLLSVPEVLTHFI